MNFKDATNVKLLEYYSQILEELRQRQVICSSNAPTGDYAEYLVCKAMDLEMQTNSTAGYDAVDSDGLRYQIKARRVTKHNGSRQLSAIRNLKDKHFDYLIGVIFNENFEVEKAIQIPHDLVVNNHRFSKHTNSALFRLEDKVWDMDGIQDLTAKIATVQSKDT